MTPKLPPAVYVILFGGTLPTRPLYSLYCTSVCLSSKTGGTGLLQVGVRRDAAINMPLCVVRTAVRACVLQLARARPLTSRYFWLIAKRSSLSTPS